MNNIKELYGEAIIDSRDSEELNIGERIKLEYYKTISKLFANGNRETYGIGIVKKYKDTKKEKIESREINNILLEEKQTEKLLKILINNKVTPIALDDVLRPNKSIKLYSKSLLLDLLFQRRLFVGKKNYISNALNF